MENKINATSIFTNMIVKTFFSMIKEINTVVINTITIAKKTAAAAIAIFTIAIKKSAIEKNSTTIAF